MKRPLLLTVMVLALLVGAYPGAAQGPDCTIRLTDVYAALANAQVAADAGNTAGALEQVAAARAALERIEAACAGGAVPATGRSGGAVVLYLGGRYFDKLDGLAFANGIDLIIAENEDQFLEQLQNANVVSAIYGSYYNTNNDHYEPSARALVALDAFIRDGGRALLLYDAFWPEQNDLLQELFTVASVYEVLTYTEGSLLLEGKALPTWLSDLRVGVQSDNPALRAYLVAPVSGAEQIFWVSQDTGRDRLVYYQNASGDVIFWARTEACFAWSYDNCAGFQPIDWFDDDNIDYFDNEQAALVMLRFLSGQ